MNDVGTLEPGAIREDLWAERQTPLILGTVLTVNAGRWTVDVRTEEPFELELRDIPIMSPYYSFKNGHGLFMIPEEGTVCVVARHQSNYFVVGFLPPPDVSNTLPKTDEASQDLFKTFQQQVTELTKTIDRNEAPDQTPGRQSYRSNREDDMIAGDGVAKTSQGNKFKWLTNGTLMAEAGKLAFTLWSRLKNTIIHVFVNLVEVGPGYSREVNVDDTESDKPVNVIEQISKSANDTKPVLIIEKGATANVFKLTVQTKDGEKRHEFRIADDGSITQKIGNDLSNPDVEISYSNSGDISRKGAGSVDEEAGTEYNIKAGTQVTVEAPNILLQDSSGGAVPLTKFNELNVAFLTHTHIGVTSGGDVSGTPSQPLDASIATTVVKGA